MMLICTHKAGKTGFRAFALAGASLLAVLASTLSVQAAELLESPVVSDSMVRLSDIFTDSGEKGNEIILQAPAPGKRSQITSYELARIAEAYNLDWERPAYLKRIYVYREGEAFSLDDLRPALEETLRELGIQSEIEINIYGKKTGLYLPAGYSVADISWKSFTLNDRKDRFIVVAEVPSGSNMPEEIRFTGTVEEVQYVPVLNRLIAPGDVIQKSDISWAKQPVRQINVNTILSAQHLVGQSVNRALPPGRLLRTTDVSIPVVVEKGSFVTITFQNGALRLSTKGRALDDGGDGDIIRVMNTKSNQTLEAKVSSSGQVVVESFTAPQLALR